MAEANFPHDVDGFLVERIINLSCHADSGAKSSACVLAFPHMRAEGAHECFLAYPTEDLSAKAASTTGVCARSFSLRISKAHRGQATQVSRTLKRTRITLYEIALQRADLLDEQFALGLVMVRDLFDGDQTKRRYVHCRMDSATGPSAEPY